MCASADGTSAGIFHRIRGRAHGGAGAPRIDAVDADTSGIFGLIGQHLAEALQREFGYRISAPVGPALAAHRRGRIDYTGVVADASSNSNNV